MSENRKVQIPVEVDATGAKAGFEEVKQGGRDMAQSLQQSAQQAGQALEGGMVASVKKTTEAMAQAKMSWTEFVKANMGPAMRQFSAEGASHAEAHTKAIRQIAEQWKVYKSTGQAALASVASQTVGAAAAAEKLTVTQQRLLDSLAKQATIAGQGKAAWLEMRAAQLGVADQAATYIARLRQAEQAQAAVGLSARQTAQALRQVPAQFTDIVTSLAAGQRPLQVLLQQGGQLKDVFGGVGPAARALGGYIAGLINPVTIGAAVIGTLAVAAHSGSEELRGFQNAAALTGNAIGVSSSRFGELRDSISGIAGTKGKAAEALTAIAQSGLSAGDNIRGIAEAAVLMEKATGQSIEKTIGQFRELQKSPADAAAKLNEQYNFLTAAIYAQIKALEEQGEKSKAAELAMRTLAEVTKERASVVVENVGYIERAWRGVGSAVQWAIDKAKEFGRDKTGAEELAGLRKRLAEREAFGPFHETRELFDQTNAGLRDRIAFLDRLNKQQEANASAAAKAAQATRDGIAAAEAVGKANEQAASKQEKLNKALEEYRRNLAAIRAADPASKLLDPKLIARTEAGIREQFKETAKAPRIPRDAFQAESLREYTQALDAFGRIATSANARAEDLSKTQEKLQELQGSPVWATYSRQQQEQVIYAASLAQAEEDRAEATKIAQKAISDATTAIAEGEAARTKQVQASEEAAAAAEREFQQYGLLKSQVQQLTLAKLEEARASAALAGEDVADIERRIAAQKRLIAAQQGVEVKEAQKKANEETLREWERTTDSIEQSLTDALLRGFESGKDFADNFRDTLRNMFSTLVLRPAIQAVMQPITSQFAGLVPRPPGMPGMPGMPGPGSILPPDFTAFGMNASQLGFLGSIAAGGAMVGQALGQMLGLRGDQMTVATVGGSLFGGVPGAILGKLISPGGGPKTESGFGPGVSQRGDPTAARAIAEGVQAQYRAIAGALAKDLQVGFFTATDPQGDAQTQLEVEARLAGASVYSRAGRLGGQDRIENVGRSEAELAAAITEESNRVILEALQATGLPDKIGAYLRQLGDVDKLSGGALTEAVQRVQKAMTERATLDAQLFALTHTALEQAAEARRKEREALDDTNRALYDHVAALSDLKAAEASARDALLNAYQAESDALKGVIDRHHGYAERLREIRDGMLLGSDSPLTRTQRSALARDRFDGTLSSAIAGNETALQALGGAGTDLLEAARNSARTPAELAAAFARVQAGLTTAASSADGRATVAQQQLDAMTEQLEAIGLLNVSVLSVGEALGIYLKAQTAIQQEQLRYAAQLAAEQASSDRAVVEAVTAVTAVAGGKATADASWTQFVQSVGSFNPHPTDGAATGGWRTTGPLLVGELGPEVVDFQTPGRVYTAEQTRGMFAANAELVPLLREVVQRLDALRSDGRTADVATVTALQKIEAKFRKWDTVGLPTVAA